MLGEGGYPAKTFCLAVAGTATGLVIPVKTGIQFRTFENLNFCVVSDLGFSASDLVAASGRARFICG
jgi:hypothetical protein